MLLLTSEELKELNKNLNAFEKFLQDLPDKALALGIRVLLAVVFFLIGMKIISFIRKILRKSLQRAGAETGVIQFLDALCKGALYFFILLAIANSFGFEAASIMALIGSLCVTIGLALQGSLSNLAGGVLILILKPFRVGDYIIEDAHKNEGTVCEIGIFYTKLQTIDNRIVVLPNGNLANNSLTNYTANSLRRIDLNIGISYSSNIAQAKQVLEQVIMEDPDIDHTTAPIVCVDSLGSSEVVIGLRCFCPTDKYWPTRWRLTEKAKLSLDEAGIEIPFQQVSVHISPDA